MLDNLYIHRTEKFGKVTFILCDSSKNFDANLPFISLYVHVYNNFALTSHRANVAL